MAGLNIAPTYVTLWDKKLSESGKYYVVRMSCSQKNDDGNYETTFSESYAWFVGKAKKKLDDIDLRAFVQITNATLVNGYNKEKKTAWHKLTVFDFETIGNASNKNANTANNNTPNAGDFINIDNADDSEELPFL